MIQCQFAVNGTKRIIGERSQMQHGVNSLKVFDDGVADVFLNVGDLDEAAAKRAGAVEVAVHTDNLVAFFEEHGGQYGANVAEMAGDKNSHI